MEIPIHCVVPTALLSGQKEVMEKQSERFAMSPPDRPTVSPATDERWWVEMHAIGLVAADEIGLPADHRADCAMDFVVDIVLSNIDPHALSEEALKEKAAQFARRTLYRLQHHNQRVKSLEERADYCKTPLAPEPVSRVPGPEERLLGADFLVRMLEPLQHFSPAQQQLFVDRLLYSKRLVDLGAENGRSANALAQSLANVIRRLQAMHAEKGISAAEVKDELSRLDRGNFIW
jgi:hypothetical protein